MIMKRVSVRCKIQPDLLEFAQKELVRDYSFFDLQDCLAGMLEKAIRAERDAYEERGIPHAGQRPAPVNAAIYGDEIPF